MLGQPQAAMWPEVEYLQHWRDNTANVRARKPDFPHVSRLPELLADHMCVLPVNSHPHTWARHSTFAGDACVFRAINPQAVADTELLQITLQRPHVRLTKQNSPAFNVHTLTWYLAWPVVVMLMGLRWTLTKKLFRAISIAPHGSPAAQRAGCTVAQPW